jgi:FkbM family methyltransferase
VASRLFPVLRFAVYGEHPQRAAIAASYLRFRVRWALSKRPLQRFSLLGTEVRFTDPLNFSYQLWTLFIEETYRGCEPPPATIVDCGCNIGMSILLFKSLWPQCNITGIEASPETFALLKENVKDLCGVTVVNKAVSNQYGVIPFYSGPNSLFNSTNALRGGARETLVEAAPLSEFITGSVDLLKIDIEGSEVAAFAELEASGKMPLIRQMFIEYHHQLPGEMHRLSSFLDRLERCGFHYELAASLPRRSGDFQDVLIRAKRKE